MLVVNIEYIEDKEMINTPYFWMINHNGVNCGHGWSITKTEALKDAYEYFQCYDNRGESYV